MILGCMISFYRLLLQQPNSYPSFNEPVTIIYVSTPPDLLLLLLKGFLAAHMLPLLYEHYRDHVDGLVYQMGENIQHHYRQVDAGFLGCNLEGKFIAKKFG